MNIRVVVLVLSALLLNIEQVLALPVSVRVMHEPHGRKIIILGDVHVDDKVMHHNSALMHRYLSGWDAMVASVGAKYVWLLEDPFRGAVLREPTAYKPGYYSKNMFDYFTLIRTFTILPEHKRMNIDVRAFTRTHHGDGFDKVVDLQREYQSCKETCHELDTYIRDLQNRVHHVAQSVSHDDQRTLKQLRHELERKIDMQQVHASRMQSICQQLALIKKHYLTCLNNQTIPLLQQAHSIVAAAYAPWLTAYCQALLDRTASLAARMQDATIADDWHDITSYIFELEVFHVDMLATATIIDRLRYKPEDIVVYMGDAHSAHVAHLLDQAGIATCSLSDSTYVGQAGIPSIYDDRIPVCRKTVSHNARQITSAIMQPLQNIFSHSFEIGAFLPLSCIEKVLQ